MAANKVLLDGVLDNLDALGYEGPLLEEGAFHDAVEGGLTSDSYTQLLHNLCGELKTSLSLQEAVSLPQGGVEDHEAFQLELRGFLAELKCPHAELIMDVCVLSSYQKRLLVLDFLVSELVSCRLLLLRQSKEQAMDTSDKECDSVAANLSAILKLYGFNKPPSTVTVRQIYDRIIGKTREILSVSPPGCLGESMVTQSLSQQQWDSLDHINQALTQEYAVRRELLLTRADVTVQSLGWSDKVKGKEDVFTKLYRERRESLEAVAPVNMARVLAAKKDSLLTIHKTSNQLVRGGTQTPISKAVLIGKVPDRGGRPRETRPPPEMPMFKKRTGASWDQQYQRKGRGGGGEGRGGGGEGRGGGGEGRGGGKKGANKGGKSSKGRVQGGWGRGGSGGGGGGGGGWGQQGNYDGHHGYQGGKAQQYYS